MLEDQKRHFILYVGPSERNGQRGRTVQLHSAGVLVMSAPYGAVSVGGG